jgi:hypothetical protein
MASAKAIHNATTGQIEIVELTAEEEAAENAHALALAWEGLRAQRNRRLAESDWTVLGDSPTSTAAWKTYRQALRDLPANTTDPTAPDWPTSPA